MRWLAAVLALMLLLLAFPTRAEHWPPGAGFLGDFIPEGSGRCRDPDTSDWLRCSHYRDPKTGVHYFAAFSNDGELAKIWRREEGRIVVVWRAPCREPCA